jgi:YVTN family beta-propeller protein
LGACGALVVLLLAVDATPALAWRPPRPGPGSTPPLTILGSVDVGRHPRGVAVHPARGWALVANEGDGSLSVVDLTALAEVSRIRVGTRPTDVAVNPTTGIAVVTLAAENAVALVDLERAIVLRKVRVGRRPQGVAVDPGLDVAVVANQDSRTVSILHLATGAVLGEAQVGRAPTDVAVHPLTRLAAVANRGDGTVTLLDLSVPSKPTMPTVLRLPGASRHSRRSRTAPAPTAVAFDHAAGLARLVVVDSGTQRVHVITLGAFNEPVDIQSVAVGGHPAAVAVHPGFDLALVAADHDDAVSLTLARPAVTGHASVGRRPRGVAIDPLACRGVVASQAESRLSVVALPCGPRLIALDPPAVQVGTSVVLTLAGSGFRPDATVNFSGVSGVTPLAVRPDTLTVAFTAPATPGAVAVSVTSGGRTSNALPLSVVTALPPVLAAVESDPIVADGEASLVIVTGARFSAGAVLLLDGVALPAYPLAGCSPPACLAAEVPGYPESTLTLAGGVHRLEVANPSGARSNALSLTIVNPEPAVDPPTPRVLPAGSPDTAVELVGSGFVARAAGDSLVAVSRVLVDGVPVPAVPSPDSPTSHLVATVPAALLATPGPREVVVVNPAPSGGASAPVPLTAQERTAPASLTIAALAVPEDVPREVAVWRDGARVLGAVGLRDRGAVRLLDVTAPAAPLLLGELPLRAPEFNALGDLGVDPGRRTLVVTLPLDDQVVLVDLGAPAGPTRRTVALPDSAFPWGVAVDPAGGRAVVTNLGTLTLSVIDLVAGTVTATIPLPEAQTPLSIAINPVTNVAVLADQGEGGAFLTVVDLGAGTAGVTIPVGSGPAAVAVNPVTNRAVAASEGDNRIVVVDLATAAIVADLPGGEQPSGVAVDPATNRALVVNALNNELTVVDLGANRVAARWLTGVVGVETPSDIAWAPGWPLGVVLLGSDSGASVTVLGLPPGALP